MSKITPEEAKFEAMVGTINRTPEYFSTKGDLRINSIPEELWERLAERCDAVKEALEEGEEKIEEISIEHFLTIKYDKKTGEEKSRTVNIDAVADYLIAGHEFKTWYGTKSDYSFNFNSKIYKKDTRGIVKAEVEKLLGVYCKKNVVEEIFEKIKRKTGVDREEFEKTDTNFICLENGVWDVEGRKLLPHEPKYNFQHIIPVSYKESAECHVWMKFVNEAFYEQDIKVIQEWFGFMLFREYFIKKAMIVEGPQNTGKSVFLDTSIKFIGEKNKTGLSLQKLTNGSDFTKLSLKDKHANIYDDLSSKDLADGGAFKVATGGGYISGEEKFGEYQQFRSFAKQMFATNKIPPVKDNDDLAYFGRWIVIKMENIPDKLDPFLRKKLWADEELSGILNWALEGLYRLLENGCFSYSKTPEQVKQAMEVSGVPLVSFGVECLEKEEGARITKEELYQVYSTWCEKMDKPRLTKTGLTQQLPKHVNYIISGKDKERIWLNAKIKQNWVITDTSDTFKNNMRDFSSTPKSDVNMGYINSKKTSEVSKSQDTNDTFSKEELEQAGLTESEFEELKVEVEKI